MGAANNGRRLVLQQRDEMPSDYIVLAVVMQGA